MLAGALAACGATSRAPRPGVPAPPSSSAIPDRAALDLVVAYREAAAAFVILDNASGWYPGKNDEQYATYLRERFGAQPDDAARFAAWADVRRRYFIPETPPAVGTDLFAHPKPPDRVAEAFYESRSLDEAFTRLSAFMTAAEVEVLRGVFVALRPRLDPLVAEGRAFVPLAPRLEQELRGPGPAAFLARAARFYGVEISSRFTVLYVWWPPVDHTSAAHHGPYLLLQYNPEKHAEDAAEAADVVVHELMHHLSLQQPEARRRALTRAFTERCNVGGTIRPEFVLEEPLAVAEQKVFLGDFAPARLDFSASWYGSPWVGALAKMIYPELREAYAAGRANDERLMARLGKSCQQLAAVGQLFAN